jgi:hypothetical protein
MKGTYFWNVKYINVMSTNVKFEVYYQILNLYKEFFINMEHKMYLKMKMKNNYSINVQPIELTM